MRKSLKVGIVILLILTAAAAAVHVNRQEEIACMTIRTSEGDIPVTFEELDAGEFTGELVNGRGEVSRHSYRGILLRDLLEYKGVDLSGVLAVTVTSADNYTAEFTPDEIVNMERVYLAVEADGETIAGIDPGTRGIQVIVFGDQNSRRCVRYANLIEVSRSQDRI